MLINSALQNKNVYIKKKPFHRAGAAKVKDLPPCVGRIIPL